MKVLIIILILLPFISNAQLSTNQKKQVDAMFVAQAKVFNKTIDSLKSVVITLNKKIDTLQVSMNPNEFEVKNKVISLKKKQ